MGRTRTFIGIDIGDAIRTNTIALQKELCSVETLTSGGEEHEIVGQYPESRLSFS